MHYVDQCNAFGRHGSGSIWIAFNGLVTWIATHVMGINNLLVYADNSFKVAQASEFTYYPPYNKMMPTDQVQLLNLWTELCIPFKEKKQIFGSPLTVIGIEVNPNTMMFTLPAQSRLELIEHLLKFSTPLPSS